MRAMAMWLFQNIPLGRLAPHVLGVALGARKKKVAAW